MPSSHSTLRVLSLSVWKPYAESLNNKSLHQVQKKKTQMTSHRLPPHIIGLSTIKKPSQNQNKWNKRNNKRTPDANQNSSARNKTNCAVVLSWLIWWVATSNCCKRSSGTRFKGTKAKTAALRSAASKWEQLWLNITKRKSNKHSRRSG